ncbi:MAG: UbiA family prenyltransferase [Candidatus Aenigmarchaeota archaeon]|nr:UbiA family prenyltransferase [Candidatus Aenigmarchaeota archaeon]
MYTGPMFRPIRILLSNSIALNIIKNSGQFIVGVALFFVTHGYLLWNNILLGWLSLNLAYSAVYPFNDIMDYESDMKNPKKHWKSLASGKKAMERTVSMLVALLLSGILLSSFLPLMFRLILVLLLITNFFHSSVHTHFKSNPYLAAPNMALMQGLKFSAGWFAMTSSAAGFPIYFIIFLGTLYSFFYLFYKDCLTTKASLRTRLYIKSFFVVAAVTFVHSFFAYGFKLLVLLTLMYVVVLIAFYVVHERFTTYDKFGLISFSLFSVFMMGGFLLLLTSTGTELNNDIEKGIESIQHAISDRIPPLWKAAYSSIYKGLQKDFYEIAEVLNGWDSSQPIPRQ